jgi:amino acid transporter
VTGRRRRAEPHAGLGIAAVLVVIYFLLNFWSVKLFAHSNTAITVFKLIVPAATGLALIASGFHRENFSVGIHGGASRHRLRRGPHGRGHGRHRLQLQRLPESR